MADGFTGVAEAISRTVECDGERRPSGELKTKDEVRMMNEETTGCLRNPARTVSAFCILSSAFEFLSPSGLTSL
jgi:hypothetical protein